MRKYNGGLPLFIGYAALIALIGGVGLWSVGTEIAGAVIANGTVVVENNHQVVQHIEGGVVGTIKARDGDRVSAGDLLIRLDDVMLKSELAVADLQSIELRARQARLRAELDGLDRVSFPAELETLGSEIAQQQIDGQRKLFDARLVSLRTEQSQIAEQIEQTHNQIEGTKAQLEALSIQQDLVTTELETLDALLEQGLVQSQRVTSQRQEAARLAGEIGFLEANVAQYKRQIATLEIERSKLGTDRQENAVSELRDIQFRELELEEQRRALNERLSRLDVRSPVSGIVYGSNIFAERAVVQPAEPLMYVIPQDQPLVVSAQIAAIDVDQVHVGQTATLRFSAFNQRTTPELFGEVVSISADAVQDEATGFSYYLVELTPKEGEIEKLVDLAVVPGMPVEAFLKTVDRTPLSYLTKPLTDYFERAMREG